MDYGSNPDKFNSFLLEYIGEHKMDLLLHLGLFVWPDLKYTVGEIKEIGELSLDEVLTRYRKGR